MFQFKLNKRKINRVLPPPCTQRELKKLIHYDPVTGILTWLKNFDNAKRGSECGWINSKGYRNVMINKKQYKAHKLAWYYMTGEWIQVDHKNIIKNDNTFNNLRPANNFQNAWNRRGCGKIYPKGVSKDNKGFRSRIAIKGKTIYLGHFFSPEEAHTAYCKAAESLHGNYARFQ